MNFRNKLVGTTAAAVLSISMFGGAFASTDQGVVDVDFGCGTQTATIDLTVSGIIDVDTSSVQWTYDSTTSGAAEIEIDLTCNWSTNFEVSATISDFEYQGVPSGNPLLETEFEGDHFRMDNGSITGYDYPILPLLTALPDFQTSVFAGSAQGDGDVITDHNYMFGPFVVWPFLASPGVTTIEWSTGVYGLPANLTPGSYQGDMTVDLSVN